MEYTSSLHTFWFHIKFYFIVSTYKESGVMVIIQDKLSAEAKHQSVQPR